MASRHPKIAIHRPVVWVTGASNGIGREIAKQFASIGCEVCLSGRNGASLKAAAREIIKLGGRSYSFPCDVRRTDAVARTVRKIQAQLGEIDVLVNNAAVTIFKSMLRTTLREFDDIIDTNLLGQIRTIKTVLPSMIKQKRGWIINILSNAAIKTFEDSAAYTATKAGMLGLARVLREEMRRYNVKVINIIPGATNTEMWSAADRKRYSHRMMRAKSVAESVLAAYRMPDDVVVDEMVIRPIQGDI